MKFNIPKTLDYVPDEGSHRAHLQHISYSPDSKPCSCTCGNKARLTFHLATDPRSPRQYVAAKTFCMEQEHGAEFLDFLQKWLGSDFGDFIDGNGSIDLDLLKGRKAWITIQHAQSLKSKYDKPFCKIIDIKPLQDDERAAA